MTIAVIDDEQHCTDSLLALLEPYKGEMETVCFNTVDGAIRGMETLRPDIVFLDVQLNEKTGFDVLSSVSHRDFCLIFTTAYEQYAIAKEDFENAMRKALLRVEQNHLNEKINVLLSHISKENNPKRISIPSKEGYSFLNITDIVRCEADVNYTHIFTLDGKKHTVSKTLKYFEGLLSPHGFFRIHSSHLINLSSVKSYAKSGYVTLSDNTKLEVSVRRKEAFIKVCNGI